MRWLPVSFADIAKQVANIHKCACVHVYTKHQIF